MGSLAYEAVIAHLWIEENLCKLYNYSHKLLTPLSEFHSCMWADVNCILFYFLNIGNQVWYILTGANLHVTCLLWV